MLRARAFTLLELIVVVAIIAMLAALLIPIIPALISKAQGVACMGNLRTLYLGFSTSLNDGNGWPQIPSNVTIGSQQEQQWWLDYSSNNLGISASVWQCPAIHRNQLSITNSQQQSLISYLPTLFDAKPMTPKSWPRMPWFTELQGAHPGGILSVRADGSVCPIQDP